MKHYELQPTIWHAKPWVFDWDEATGTVTGPDAAEIVAMSKWGGIGAHPLPWAVEFSAEPLRSKTDMAAIIGLEHQLPEDLAPYYPRLPDDGFPDTGYLDEDDVWVVGRDEVLF